MMCPHCQQAKQRSTVRVVRSKPTLIPKDHFFDEDGQEHHHDPNITRTDFRCSNNHTFTEVSSWECWCGYMACKAQILGEWTTKEATA